MKSEVVAHLWMAKYDILWPKLHSGFLVPSNSRTISQVLSSHSFHFWVGHSLSKTCVNTVTTRNWLFSCVFSNTLMQSRYLTKNDCLSEFSQTKKKFRAFLYLKKIAAKNLEKKLKNAHKISTIIQKLRLLYLKFFFFHPTPRHTTPQTQKSHPTPHHMWCGVAYATPLTTLPNWD